MIVTPPHHNQRGGGRPVCNCTLAPGKWDQESRKLGMMALQPGENPPVDAKVHNFSYSLNGIRWPAERPYGLGPIEQAGYGDQPVVQ